jgi:hypothetical protein
MVEEVPRTKEKVVWAVVIRNKPLGEGELFAIINQMAQWP